jgi:hypothetical protein
MYEQIILLQENPQIASVEVLEFIDEEDIQLLHLVAKFKDGSRLFIRELVTPTLNRYSYHWQDKDGRFLTRWDNAPHHPKIETFPHHKHIENNTKIVASTETDIPTVLKIIEKELKKTMKLTVRKRQKS